MKSTVTNIARIMQFALLITAGVAFTSMPIEPAIAISHDHVTQPINLNNVVDTAKKGPEKSTGTGTTSNSTSTTNTTNTTQTTTTTKEKPKAPTISITAPANKATLIGTGNITVKVSSAQGIANVQYKLDGANLGSPVTTSPYSYSWNTTTTTNGSHTLTAVATDKTNLSTTSAAIKVTVNNPVVDPNPPITSPTTPPTNTDLSPSAKISFTFDDGLSSAYSAAQPTLAKYGLTGTDYIITGCVDMVTQPNTCRANTDTTYMSWQQIEQLQNDGWEIGSHTVDHDCLASSAAVDPDDCQTNTLTQAQVDAELSNSKAALAAHGINATDFAPPYGDYNNMVLAEIAKYYASMRGFKDTNVNGWPFDDYLLNDYAVQETTDTVASVEAKIDSAIASNSWLILTFHDIKDKPSTNPDDYEFGTAELDQIAAYVKAKQDAGQVKDVNINQGLVNGSPNLMPNGNFNDGIADGWTTDAPTNITADNGGNGSYPDPTNSIKLTSAPSGNAHLYSPKIAVASNTTYMIKSFLNVQAISSGEVGYYIDEYDANGNWISGQFKKAEPTSFVEDMNFTYTPSSPNVRSASLQIIDSGSGLTAYVANVQWFVSNVVNTPPTNQTNLVSNGTFDAGISSGWTTDAPANIVADSNNNGSPNNPINSVVLTAPTTSNNAHLFSPQVAVASTNQYTITAYLNLLTINSGEVAFYMDEYDTGGNWISGQYKMGVYTVGAGDVSFTYTPSSANVASASLQIIVVGNSGITAYIDDIRWYLG